MTDEHTAPSDARLSPGVREALDALKTPGVPSSDVSSIETARAQFHDVMTTQPGGEVERVTDFSIPGPASDIPLRTYRPAGAGPFPVVVFFHGGGWTLGDLDCYDSLCTHLAEVAGCVVVSCGYRLAPEHPFPAAPKDCYAATEWVAKNAAAVDGDPDLLAVAGTSAGGNLAASVTLLARDRDGPAIAHQTLLYPCVNPMGLDEFESYRTYSEGYSLTTASMHRFYREYIANPVDARNAYAFPLQSRDLSGLPPATIVSAEFDPLKDEAFEYARRLEADGVSVSHHHFEAMTHDFLSMTEWVDTAMDGFEVVANDLSESFETR